MAARAASGASSPEASRSTACLTRDEETPATPTATATTEVASNGNAESARGRSGSAQSTTGADAVAARSARAIAKATVTGRGARIAGRRAATTTTVPSVRSAAIATVTRVDSQASKTGNVWLHRARHAGSANGSYPSRRTTTARTTSA